MLDERAKANNIQFPLTVFGLRSSSRAHALQGVAFQGQECLLSSEEQISSLALETVILDGSYYLGLSEEDADMKVGNVDDAQLLDDVFGFSVCKGKQKRDLINWAGSGEIEQLKTRGKK